MSMDYLIPLFMGLVMLGAPCVLVLIAWRQRPAGQPHRRIPAHNYRPGQRQAYNLARAKVYACFATSAFGALVAGVSMAFWLPLAAAENALLATLVTPLLWAAVLVFLLMQTHWRRDCLITLAVGVLALLPVLIPLTTG